MKSVKSVLIVFFIITVVNFPFIFIQKCQIQENLNDFGYPSLSQLYNSYYINWSGTDDEEGFSVISDLDNNIYVGGYTKSYGAGDEDLLLVKFNNLGQELWNATWGGTGRDSGRCVVVDSENNVYLLGITNSSGAGGDDICLLKYNSSGDLEKEIIWGTNETEIVYDMCIDPMDNIYISGCRHYESSNEDKLLVIKFDSNGNEQWNSTDIGGTPKFSGFYAAITYVSSDLLYLFHTVMVPKYQLYIAKFNSDGFDYGGWGMGGPMTNYYAGDIAIDSNNITYLSIFSSDYGDTLIKKNESTPGTIWEKHWWGVLLKETRLAIDSYDRIYLMGHMKNYGVNDASLVCIEFNTQGDEERYIKWEEDLIVFGRSITVDSLNNIYITGRIEDTSTNTSNVVLIKNFLRSGDPDDATEIIINSYELIIVFMLFSIISVVILFRKKIHRW